MARLEHVAQNIAIKSKNGKYLSASTDFAHLLQVCSPEKMRGLTEYDIIPYSHHTPHYESTSIIEEFYQEDEETLRGKSLLIFGTVLIQNQLVFWLSHKSPHRVNNKIEGTLLHVIPLPDLNKQAIKCYVSNPDIIISGHTKKHLDVFDLAPHRKYKFSKREIQCLQLLVQGKSAKEIARVLTLSNRTVEFYISRIKDKLNVNKTAEVTAKAISECLVN